MLSAFTRGTVLLPNDDALPTADASTECFEENLLSNGALLPNSAHMSVSSLYQFLVLTPRLLGSTSQSAAPRKIQASGDHQVRCRARSSTVAQVLRSLNRERWWQQRHEVPLLPFLPGPSCTYMARVTQEVLDGQVGPAQEVVHQQHHGHHGTLGYSHGPGHGEAGTGRDLAQVHAALL
jgi:hypothetical protein